MIKKTDIKFAVIAERNCESMGKSEMKIIHGERLRESDIKKIGGGEMATSREPYKKPNNANELGRCEYIEEMRKVYFQPPKQSKNSCEGYRNQYTHNASTVCSDCEWFYDNVGS